MNDCRKFYKGLIICIFSIAMILNIGLPVYAAVYTVPSDSDEADTVYVAGNPNAYPLEYYSKEDKAFCGVFPDMLFYFHNKIGRVFTFDLQS